MGHKRRKKIKASTIVKAVIAIVLAGGLLTGAVIILKDRVKTQFADKNESNIKSATVESGDTVKKGDTIATVDMSTVLSAMSSVQADIDKLDKKIKSAADDEVDDEIKSKVKGRVKKIYAAKGDDVSSVMSENSALLLISMDGYMAVDIENANLKEGDKVKVTTSKDKTYTGKVDKISGSKATIIVTDNGPVPDDNVTVKDNDGKELGKGSLYIHDPLSVVGYAGTVKSVSVEENEKIKVSTVLFKLKNTSYTANYEQYLSERKDLEDTLLDLTAIYRDGALESEYEGVVKTVPDTDDTSEDAATTFEICPNKTMTVEVSIDETDILSLSAGQKVDVSITSIEDETFEGTINEIDKTGTSSSGVTTYTAKVQIEKKENMLAGMSATASITINSVDNALTIPLDALKQTSSTAYVYTTYDEETNTLGGMTEVETGISNSSYVEIKSGLSEGDTVYYKETDTTKNNSGFPGGGDFPGGNFYGGNFPGGSRSSSGRSSFPGGDFSGGSSGKRGES